ncbi:MAG: serine/threonine-protein kinase [Candidatus Aminicenantales bacterium]
MDKIGKYKILGILGKGGMGIVYKALDPDIEREVAIKTIRFDTLSEGTQKDDLIARFIREARAAGKISHPNIVTIYEVGRENDLTYIVMQYVEGQSLQSLIDSGKKFSLQEIAELMGLIGDALDYAHQSGIIHRDIKPANILLDKSGKPFLADFGVARMDSSTMTQSGTTVGTLSYMSPEQITGQSIDGRSDLFALGIILYELLSGKKPFFGDNISTIVYQIVHEQPRRIREVNAELPVGYDIVIQKILAKSPDDRYPTGRALIAALENAEKILEQTLAYDTDKKRSPAAVAKKKPGLVVGLGVIGVAIVGGMIILLSSKPSKPSGAALKPPPVKKEEAGPIPRGDNAPPVSPAVDENTVQLKAAFEAKKYDETVKLAEDILAKTPAHPAAQDYMKKAKNELLAIQTAPILRTAISFYNGGNYAQCLQETEKVLALDRDNKEAQRYQFLADTALSKPDILDLIEKHRIAEENKDLLTLLSHVGSPTLSAQLQDTYKMLFNGYDDIKSMISNITVNFSSRSEAAASFSRLLTAVSKKDGKRKIVFEETKAWQIRKQGKVWLISGTG